MHALFMKHAHDRIFEARSQASLMSAWVTGLYESIMPIEVQRGTCPWRPEAASAVRATRCEVKATRIESFLSMQREVWNPGMRAASGFQGGHVARSLEHDHCFFVVTYWDSREAHDAYRADVFPGLKTRARTSNDIAELSGRVFGLDHQWTVASSSFEG